MSNSPHVMRLMGHSGSKGTAKENNRLMGRSRHADGGMIGGAPMGNMASNVKSYMPAQMPQMDNQGQMLKRGGRARRAEGGDMDYQGTEAMGKSPITKKRGGRACHAEGDRVESEMKRRGGSAHRKRRSIGGSLGQLLGSIMPFKEGGEAEMKKRGGRARRADGGDMEDAMRRGGHARRKHRAEGGGFSDLLSAAGPLLMHLAPMLLKAGGRARRAEGGDMEDNMRRGGHARRKRRSEGDEVRMEPLKRAMGGAGKVRKGMMSEDGDMR